MGYEKLAFVVHVSYMSQNLVISRCCFEEDVYSYGFAKLNLLFDNVLVATVVVVYLSSLISTAPPSFFTYAKSPQHSRFSLVIENCLVWVLLLVSP